METSVKPCGRSLASTVGRLSPHWRHAGAQGHDRESHAALPTVRGRRSVRSSTVWPRVRGGRTPIPVPLRPGGRWSMDFVSDTFGASCKFRILAINDGYCRENPCHAANTRISSARVARRSLSRNHGVLIRPAGLRLRTLRTSLRSQTDRSHKQAISTSCPS